MEDNTPQINAKGAELLTIKQYCAKIKKSRQTVYRWIDSGKIVTLRVGSQQLILVTPEN